MSQIWSQALNEIYLRAQHENKVGGWFVNTFSLLVLLILVLVLQNSRRL
jgi:hypothetical protein